jgi:hypothetical protein
MDWKLNRCKRFNFGQFCFFILHLTFNVKIIPQAHSKFGRITKKAAQPQGRACCNPATTFNDFWNSRLRDPGFFGQPIGCNIYRIQEFLLQNFARVNVG